MTFPQAMELFEYWSSFPPEHEILAMLARAYTTWEPQDSKPMTAEMHRESLEARWKSGAMNAKQMFDAMGGSLSVDGSCGESKKGADMPGVGPFPGAH